MMSSGGETDEVQAIDPARVHVTGGRYFVTGVDPEEAR
jgi:hypothetical protein